MKNLFVIISLVVVALFSSCTKEKTITNRFMVVGDYTFEVVSGPDKHGYLEVKIVNLNDSLFGCYQEFNDYDAMVRIVLGGAKFYSYYESKFVTERKITIHQTSGISIYPKVEEQIDLTKKSMFLSNIRIPEPSEVKIFESASNFFGIN